MTKQKGFFQPLILIGFVVIALVGLYIYENKTVIYKGDLQEVETPLPTPTPSPTPYQTYPYSSPVAFEPAENGLKKYKNSEYEITFPEEWVAQPTYSGFGEYQSFANREPKDDYDPSILGLSIRLEKFEPGYENQTILDGFTDPVGKVRDGEKAIFTKKANMEINGLKTAKVYSDSAGKPVDFYLQMYYWIKVDDKTYYELSFGSTEDLKQYDKVMDQIAKSFKLH